MSEAEQGKGLSPRTILRAKGRRWHLSRDQNEARDYALKPPGGCLLLVGMVPQEMGQGLLST